ncbi:hypothetical protein SAMN05216419_100658 [Nitrosomonas cryotolerans]|nr:hypothetical protein SAMN05216419_100658 [Nitrosomonas cryotolerans]
MLYLDSAMTSLEQAPFWNGQFNATIKETHMKEKESL